MIKTMWRYIALITLVAGCSHPTPQPAEHIQNVKCSKVVALRYEERDFAALSTADDAVNLAFKISGRVINIPVAKGMAVKRGEVLAELDKRDVELQVEAAKATYIEQQSRLRRAERLLEHNAISQQEVESLESSLTQARSAYENSLDLLLDTRIVAPFDGVVERTYVDAFQRVASGETILRIVNPVSSTIGFTAPESIVTILDKPTTRFEVCFDAWPTETFAAVIKSFARTSSDALGFPVSLRLINVDSKRYDISPGMTCMVRVITPEHDSHAVEVPLTAIYAPTSGGDYVWVVDKDNRVHSRKVSISRSVANNSVVIDNGLEEGEVVVTAGVYKLTEGQSVRIVK